MGLPEVPGHVVLADEPLVAELAAEGQVVLVVSHLVRPQLGSAKFLTTDRTSSPRQFLVRVGVGQVVVQLPPRWISPTAEVAYKIFLLEIGVVYLLCMGFKMTCQYVIKM